MSITQRQSCYQVSCSILEARSLRTGKQMAVKLLSGICDATVELDTDLDIVDGLQQLEGLLLKKSSPKPSSLQTSILKFMPERDATKFQEHLRIFSDFSAAQAVHPIHLHMLDASSSKVSLELFCTGWTDADGLAQYLVGIREYNDDIKDGFNESMLSTLCADVPESASAQATLIGAPSGLHSSDLESDSDSSEVSGPSVNVFDDPIETWRVAAISFNGAGWIRDSSEAFSMFFEGANFGCLADFLHHLQGDAGSVRLVVEAETSPKHSNVRGQQDAMAWEWKIVPEIYTPQSPETSFFTATLKKQKERQHSQMMRKPNSAGARSRASRSSGTPRVVAQSALLPAGGSDATAAAGSAEGFTAEAAPTESLAL
eukprot:TRINITY_DN110145_c0_g1_i1.p1 TRINITY_DN110145_c0_g1~~TRINITY_DN110145_c0_g1_i1.p1  ORF type:complete len:382 (+),score=77.85 TRINITY_DN110145_c0_g1_i1:32-1147(+)